MQPKIAALFLHFKPDCSGNLFVASAIKNCSEKQEQTLNKASAIALLKKRI